MEKKDLKKEISNLCGDEQSPCSVTFTIRETLNSFNQVVNIFSSAGFNIENFADDFMCVLSRDNEGINEAIKVKGHSVQIQALKTTLMELSDKLAEFCSGLES